MTPFWQGFQKRAESAYEKRRYGEVMPENLDPERRDEVWTSKIDGAHTVVLMSKGHVPKLFSHRQSKKTGKPIEYTEKLPHISQSSPVSALVRGETYAVDKGGRAVHPDVVTQILNSGKERSLALQRSLGIKTKTALIDIDHWDGVDMKNAPFREKRRLMEQLAQSNKDFTVPDIAVTPNEKRNLFQKIKDGTHPETLEGVVIHRGEKYLKGKLSKEHDVHIRDIFHEEGTKADRQPMAGGFTYSWTEDGPVVGRVGTGFDHAMKKDMLKNPGKYVGKVARVRALAVSKNKVLMKPSFKMLHVEKNIDE